MKPSEYLDVIWFWDRAKAKPGERIPINDAEFNYCLNVLPPHTDRGLMAVGEPYDLNIWLWFGPGWALLGTYGQARKALNP